MIVGSVCMSHSPLMDRNRAAPEAEARFNAAVGKASTFVAELEPDLTVVFYPDHINGFFYNLLPAFCVGIEGSSIGDFGTVSGKLDIPEALASDCAESLLNAGIDVAISHRLQVDHGAVQPLELLAAKHPLSRIVPVFINCAAAPRPSFARARALGKAVGAWADARPERILLVGSGGLSHDPPIPSMATASPEIRNRLIEGGSLSHTQRLARQSRALQEGHNLAADVSQLIPLNPEWDKALLEAVVSGNLALLDDRPDSDLTAVGGKGAHEVRCWMAALATMSTYRADILFYEPIKEWITGMGIVTARAA